MFKTIIEQLKAERQLRGLSQVKVAERAGFCFQQLCAWERHRKKPRIDILEAWAEALGMQIVLTTRPLIRDAVSGITNGVVMDCQFGSVADQ